MMKYQDAIEFIEECNKLGSIPGLESITELTRLFGSPQDFLKFIHISGTNGKGSTLAYISTVLKIAGYKVGRYISPTIYEYRERFQINGRMMSKKDLVNYLEIAKEYCEQMVALGYHHPTSFEIETAIAFQYFKDNNCDIVVLETGMGGLLDATNLIKTTIVSVITPVSMDHMQYLGNTITDIARQKAGIIKEHVDIVTLQTDVEALNTINKVSLYKHAPITIVEIKDAKKVKYGLNIQSFCYHGEDYKISLAGTYQIENAMLSVSVLKLIESKKLLERDIKEDIIKRGLLETKWDGRFTIIGKRPYFIVDGAHNEAASKQVADSIDFYFTNKRKIYIMGMFRDKEYEKVIKNTVSKADQIITVKTPNNSRALDAYELAACVRNYNENVTAVDSLEEAVEISYLFADKESVIIAFGSLSFLGKLISIVEKHKVIRS